MPRKPCIIVPDLPHHVTHRGTRRQTVFFETRDYLVYKSFLQAACAKYGVEVWAYCFMPNHVHLIVVPSTVESLSKMIGIAHKQYANFINKKNDWRGHLWEERYGSVPMDEGHLFAAGRYVELNPVRAGLAMKAETYRWSSVHAHINARDDGLVLTKPLLQRYGDWRRYLELGLNEEIANKIRRNEKSGLPLGGDAFVEDLEIQTGQCLRAGKPGPKPKG